MPVDKEIVESEKWYTRPVFSVADVEKSLHHYCELLGFEQAWKYQENDRTIVTQVNKGDFELILTQNLDRVGKARVFISLEEWELDKLQKDIVTKQIPSERSHWGYPLIKVSDSDGNEMMFPLEDEE